MSGRKHYWRDVARSTWRAMGWWRWLALTLIVISLALTPLAGPARIKEITYTAESTPDAEPIPFQLASSARWKTGRTFRLKATQLERWRYRLNSGVWFEMTQAEAQWSDEGDEAVKVEACTPSPASRCWTFEPMSRHRDGAR
ncbi:MAG: hypothetical protein AAF736_06520 [Pseudomonadota bacterium]